MIRTVLLLLPIYVALFWSIALASKSKKHSEPRRFLGGFMLFPLIIYISHFIYFVPLPALYPYFDIVLQFASLMVFPLYHIYFRLLTVEEKFTLTTDSKFLVLPVLITILYSIGVLLTPKIEYRTWLNDENAYSISPYIQFLAVMRMIIRVTYLIQVIATLLGNYLLIKKYGAKAEQFYSDEQDGKFNNAVMLNRTIIYMSIGAFAYTVMGRQFLILQDVLICIGWTFFAAMLFLIGYMGITQKPINPTFDLVIADDLLSMTKFTSNVQKKILEKLLVEFEQNKIYLNSQLNIMDVVNVIGTNRSYISALINQQYNNNFCSFVNYYRVEELERVFSKNPDFTIEVLAEKCGFGSVNSLKRAITGKTGLSFTDWKKQIKYI